MKRWTTRWMTILLSAMIAFSAAVPLQVSAAENVFSGEQVQNGAAQAGGQVLTGLSITDLDRPAIGIPFDTTATVRSAEGVSWTIPVLWVDENGAGADVPSAGHTYMPVFVFFLPEGHILAYGSLDAGPGVILPSFLTMTTGNGAALYVENAELGITYITGGAVSFPAAAAVQAERGQSDSQPDGPAAYAADSSSEVSQITGRADESEDEDEQDEEEEEEQEEEQEQEQEEEPSDDDRTTREVYIHCDPKAIDTLGTDLLSKVVSMIKYEIEPKAVKLLTDSFPAYASGAARGEIGREIGLYIYYESGESEGDKTPANSLASVNAQYREVVENGQKTRVYKYLVLVDTADFAKKDKEGSYAIDNSKLGTLKNTVVHELMHAFMDDYTRTGMACELELSAAEAKARENMSATQLREEMTKTYFPTWFIEGTASSVENVYQFRRDDFLEYGFEKNTDGTYTCDRQKLLDYYSDNTIKQQEDGRSVNPQLSYAENVYIYDWQNANNTLSAYNSGYLACVYLSKLAAENVLNKTVRTEKGDSVFYSTEAVRSGMNYILEQLHNNVTLDAVIKNISKGAYESTDEFTDYFIKGKDGTGDAASLDFCVDFLNHLEYGTTDTEISNGSILLEHFRVEQTDPLKDVSADAASQDILKITDSKSPVASTADNSRALMTGGTSMAGRGGVNPDDSQEQKMAAKATAPEETMTAEPAAAPAAAPAEDALPVDTEAELTEVPAGEVVPVEPDAVEPAAEAEAEPVIIPEAEPLVPAIETETAPAAAPAEAPAEEALPVETAAAETEPAEAPAETEAEAAEPVNIPEVEVLVPAIETETAPAAVPADVPAEAAVPVETAAAETEPAEAPAETEAETEPAEAIIIPEAEPSAPEAAVMPDMETDPALPEDPVDENNEAKTPENAETAEEPAEETTQRGA